MGVSTIWPYLRYDGNTIFKQHNQVSPPSGHWNLGTLEPRVHRERKGHRPENRHGAPTQGTALSGSGIPLAVTGGLSAARFVAAHGGYDVLGRCMLVAGTVFGLPFPETPRGGAVPQHLSELIGRSFFTNRG